MWFIQEGYKSIGAQSFPPVPLNVMVEWVDSQDEVFSLKTRKYILFGSGSDHHFEHYIIFEPLSPTLILALLSIYQNVEYEEY